MDSYYYFGDIEKLQEIKNTYPEIFDIVDYNVPLYEIIDSWDDVNADGISAQFRHKSFSSGAEGKQTKENNNCHCHPEDAGKGCDIVIPFAQFQQFAVRGNTIEKYAQPFADCSAVDGDDHGGNQEQNGKEIFPFGVVHDFFKMFPF